MFGSLQFPVRTLGKSQRFANLETSRPPPYRIFMTELILQPHEPVIFFPRRLVWTLCLPRPTTLCQGRQSHAPSKSVSAYRFAVLQHMQRVGQHLHEVAPRDPQVKRPWCPESLNSGPVHFSGNRFPHRPPAESRLWIHWIHVTPLRGSRPGLGFEPKMGSSPLARRMCPLSAGAT